MARGDLSISIAADTRNFDKAVNKGIIDPLEEASAALEAVAKDGDTAGNKLESSMKDAAKQTDDLTERQSELRKALDKTSTSGRRTGTDLKDGFKDAKHGAEEFKDEANSTAREAAASFDGSAQSIADMFQEVAANAFAGFGPAGAMAGLAVAAGIGLAVSAFDNGQASSEAMRAKVAELAQELISVGQDAKPSLDYLVQKLQGLATATDGTKLADLGKAAAKSGQSFKDLAQAYAGNTEGLKDLIKKQGDQLTSLKDEREFLLGLDRDDKRRTADALQNIELKINGQQKYVDYLNEAGTAATQAAEAEKYYNDSGARQLEQKSALIDSVNGSYDDAAGAVDNYVNSETGVFNTQAYIDAMNAKLSALGEYQTLLANSSLSQSARSYLSNLGADAAAQLMQAYKNGTENQRSNLDRIWAEAGRSNSGQYVSNVRNAIPDRIDKQPTVTLRSDTAQAQNEINRFIDRTENRTMRITATVVDRAGRPIL